MFGHLSREIVAEADGIVIILARFAVPRGIRGRISLFIVAVTTKDMQKDQLFGFVVHRNSRRKPPNSFGWRNAANLSLPIYLVVPDERRVSFHPLC